VGVLFPPTIATVISAGQVIMFRGIVLKMHKSLTFLATIQNDVERMKTLAVISVLALLALGGAAYTDQLFSSDLGIAQRAN